MGEAAQSGPTVRRPKFSPRSVSRAICIVAFVSLASCGDTTSTSSPKQPERPANYRVCTSPDGVCVSLSVLVDVSGTWNTHQDRAQNQAILRELGDGIVQGLADMSPAIVRYHSIGAASRRAPPLCQAVYNPVLIAASTPSQSEIRNSDDLSAYIRATCNEAVFHEPPADETQITAAITGASNAMEITPGEYRIFFLVSDFREETAHPGNLDRTDLCGADFILLYRVLRSDEDTVNATEQRTDSWAQRLRARGAHVAVFQDNAITALGVQQIIEQGAPDASGGSPAPQCPQRAP